MALGVWLLLGSLTFSYARYASGPAPGLEPWYGWAPGPEARAFALAVNDALCGATLILCGWLGVLGMRRAGMWLAFAVGMWLNIATLLAWAPSPFIYLNETFCGMAAMLFALVVPGIPGIRAYALPGPLTPPGWSHNPSAWPSRLLKMTLALLGWMAARYLAAYQLGYSGAVWDPLFGSLSSQAVLTSSVSKSLPMPDGGLGAFVYSMDFILAALGPADRWRTAPWAVLLYGMFVLPTALVGLFLFIAMPLVVGSWCTVCLISSLVMLPVVPMAVDECVAALGFLLRRDKSGVSAWKRLFVGSMAHGKQVAPPPPHMIEMERRPGLVLGQSARGMGLPWNLLLVMLLGAWLMLAPALLHTNALASAGMRVAGPFFLVIAILACGEVLRPLRWINLLIGAALAVFLLLSGAGPAGFILGGGAALAAAAASVPRGILREQYNGMEKYIV